MQKIWILPAQHQLFHLYRAQKSNFAREQESVCAKDWWSQIKKAEELNHNWETLDFDWKEASASQARLILFKDEIAVVADGENVW